MTNDRHPILFFSDAHFGAHSPEREAAKVRNFTDILSYARNLRAEVFFMGDLFDFWFEYRHWIPKAPIEVLSAILQFTADGGRFHLILGNHDIWASDYFSRHLGITVHRDDTTVNRQGLRIRLSHGDGKAGSDRGYRVLKRILRFKPNIALYRLLPADWAFGLARFFSGRSRELTSQRSPRFAGEYDTAAQELIRSGFDAVVMGHLHLGCVRRFGKGWWVNTGEFFERFDYVLLENAEFHLRQWPQSGGDLPGS